VLRCVLCRRVQGKHTPLHTANPLKLLANMCTKYGVCSNHLHTKIINDFNELTVWCRLTPRLKAGGMDCCGLSTPPFAHGERNSTEEKDLAGRG